MKLGDGSMLKYKILKCIAYILSAIEVPYFLDAIYYVNISNIVAGVIAYICCGWVVLTVNRNIRIQKEIDHISDGIG